MKKFKNLQTGNVVRPKTAEAEKLMSESKQYTEIPAPKKPKGQTDAAQ